MWRAGRGFGGDAYRYHLAQEVQAVQVDRPIPPRAEAAERQDVTHVSTPSMSDDVQQQAASGASSPSSSLQLQHVGTHDAATSAPIHTLPRRSMYDADTESGAETESDGEVDADFIRRPSRSVGALSRFFLSR